MAEEYIDWGCPSCGKSWALEFTAPKKRRECCNKPLPDQEERDKLRKIREEMKKTFG